MKLACQENLIDGKNLKEKVAKLEYFGFDGVELWGRDIGDRLDEVKESFKGRKIKVSTICSGYRGSLLDSSLEERRMAMDDIKKLLVYTSELGAIGLIMVPVFGAPRLPDLSPLMGVRELEEKLLVEELNDLGEFASEQGVYLLLEPLNRYETHFIKCLDDAASIIAQTHKKGIKMMADFFHMSIEERDIAESLKNHIDDIAHIHLADSNRLLPGMGHTDFKEPFKALKQSGYTGYMALECGVPGDPNILLPKAVEFLHEQIDSIS